MNQLPILLHEDTAKYEATLTGFLTYARPAIQDIKISYEKLKLGKLFTDEVWRDIANGGRQLEKAYTEKVEAVQDLLGVTAGITGPGVMTKAGAFQEIAQRLNRLTANLSGNGMNQFYLVDLADLVNVATYPEISEAGKTKVLERFRVYINTPEELEAINNMNAFVEA